MAQLKDSLITGSLRVTDTIFSTNLNLSSLTADYAVLTDANKNLVSRGITNNTSATAVVASTNLITANTLYYHKGNSNIVTVGTISSGTWQGTTIGTAYGGTGNTSFTQWGVIYANPATKLVSTAAGTSGYLLQGNGSAAPSWIQATNSNTASTIVKRDASGNFSAGTITATLSGNASTATTWQTARTLTIGATGKSVNGSADVSWSMDDIMGSSDSSKFYRGDKTWSNTIVGAFTASSSGSNRANINMITVADQPNDFYFGNNNASKWSITSRASNESYNLYVYSTGSGVGYATGWEYSTGKFMMLHGASLTGGSLVIDQPATARRNGIIGTYDYTKAAAIWAMGSSYQIAADGSGLGSLYGAAYVYQGQGGTGGKTLAGGHQFVWAENGGIDVALGSNGVWIKKNGGIYWDPYVESASDASDVTSIYQIANGVAGGTELRISQANDNNDVINICSPKYIYMNSKVAFDISDSWLRINESSGFSSGVYFGGGTGGVVRTDNQFQVGDSGNKFYANSSGNGYFSNTLGIGTTNTSYKLTINGGTLIKGANFIEFENSGSWGASDATFPNNRGGLYWSGTSDWVRIFCTETSSDNFQLIVDFGDDTSPSMILRDRGTNKITLTPSSSTISATTFSGALSGNATTATTATNLNGGTVTATSITANNNIGIYNNGSSGGSNKGISLYNGTGFVLNYGLLFELTSSLGTHYTEDADWATYFTMDGSTNRGWIFRHASRGNIASINCNGCMALGFRSGNYESAHRLCLVPPYHTGGPWYVDAYDPNGSYAFCDFIYNTSHVFQIRHDGHVWASAGVHNAVWNDLAECRKSAGHEAGRAIEPNGTYTTKRLQAGVRIISDTWGFILGDDEDKDKAPVAISGRVLAYPYQNISAYNIGDAVCSAPNGTVDIMTRDEIMLYPDRIIGIVNEIPDYDIWEPSKKADRIIYINNRIWIDIK